MTKEKYFQRLTLKLACLIFMAFIGTACQIPSSQQVVLPQASTTATLDIPQPTVDATKISTPTSIMTVTDTESMLMCEQKFQKVAVKLETIRHESEVTDLVQSFVTAGEYYLNYCLDQQTVLADQKEGIEKLRTLAEIIPKIERCGFRYDPTIQLLDLDGDEQNELILNAQLGRCDINYEHRGVKVGSGGINVIYYLNDTINQWQGYVLWPHILWTCDQTDCSSFGMQSTANIQILPAQDKQSHPLLLLTASGAGGDANTEWVFVGRWDNGSFETLLDLEYRNWCHPFPAWEVTPEGHIFVPEVEITRPDLCPDYVSKDSLYVYENGKFSNKLTSK